MYQEAWWEIVLVPFRIFFEGQDDTHRFFDGRLNPALLALPLFSFFASNRNGKTTRVISFDVSLFTSAIRSSASPEELHSYLFDIGFTHLLIRFDMFDNWCNHNLDQKEKQMVIELLSIRDSLLFEKNGHGLYKMF